MLGRIIIFPSQGLHKKGGKRHPHHLAHPAHPFLTQSFPLPPPHPTTIPTLFLPYSSPGCLSLVRVCMRVCLCVHACRLDCWKCRIRRWSWKQIKEPASGEFANGRNGLTACCFCPSAEANYLKGPHLAWSGLRGMAVWSRISPLSPSQRTGSGVLEEAHRAETFR